MNKRTKLINDTTKSIERLADEIEDLQDDNDLSEALFHGVSALKLRDEGRYSEALTDINMALGLWEMAPFYHTKAEILMRLDRTKEALRVVNKCLQIEGEEIGDGIIQAHSPGTCLLKSKIYYDLGKYKLAIDSALTAIKLFKKRRIDPTYKNTLTEAIYAVGHNYLHLKKYQQSFKWLKKAELSKKRDGKLDSDIGEIAFDKAYVLLKMKRYNEAWSSAGCAVFEDIKNGEYWLMLSYCLAINKKDSFEVLRSLNLAYWFMPDVQEEKTWVKEIKVITRYLKNVDEDEFVKSAIKSKKKWEILDLFYPKGPKDWGTTPKKIN